ncbi:hypothetical protein GWK08_16675 [Leptobacterium flavescens]|uniref:Uncharacterized protein n=1 Tax=Leptobacterium flavescens TaxID=472055 RepID=A0A6P0UNY9_9FLAO|nr:hypothetical protein [Leptobacterium flavescens]NER15091.1 hypothetical protein [Leptobacterium flavescens]
MVIGKHLFGIIIKSNNLFKKYTKLTYQEKSMILYGISLITPIFFGSWLIGVFGLIFGIVGVFEFNPFLGLPWIANFLYFGNLIFRKINLKLKTGISFLTITFGLFTIGIRKVPVHEGGLNADVIVGIGFILWLSSFIILLIGQIKDGIK